MIDLNNIQPLEDIEVRKKRVKAACEGRVKEVVRYLYPKAVFGPKDARVGSVDGAKGSSMSIALTPDVPGQWLDHATGDRGDILTLWQRALGVDFASAIREADRWAGGAPSQRAETRHQTEAAKPSAPDSVKREVASYPYHAVNGELLFEVVRFDEYDATTGEPVLKGGKVAKTFMPRQPSGQFGYPPGPRPLYRLPEIERSREIVFVEGEKAADALHRFGWVATSAPGGSSTKLDAIDWRPLAGKSIILWPDNDEAGRRFMDRVAAQVASIGCAVRWVTLPESAPDKWDAGDADEEQIHALLSRSESGTPKHEITYHLWPDIEFHYEPELVEDLLPQIGLATIYGPSTVGKSFVALDWVATIGTGRSLFGRDTESVGIIYLAFEGFHGIKKRIHGIKQEKGLRAVALELVDAPWTLTEEVDWAGMRAHITASNERLEETGFPLGVIVVDTLTAAYAGTDANSQAEVTKAMKHLKRLAMDLKCLVLVIGHTGKDTARGMVGSFAYKSESDTFIELQVEKDELDNTVRRRSVFVEKVKDGASEFTLADYDLREVRIGTKPNGKPITTCVVEWNPTVKKRAVPTYTGPLQAILEALQDGGLTTWEVAEKLGVDRSNAGKKLRKMEQDGAIFAREDGARKIWVAIAHTLPSEDE